MQYIQSCAKYSALHINTKTMYSINHCNNNVIFFKIQSEGSSDLVTSGSEV